MESSENFGSGWPTPKPTHQDDSYQESLSFLVRQCYLVLSDILQTFIRSIALKFTFPVDFDLNVDDNGNVFDLNISAGPTRVGAGDYLAVQNTFQVKQINV